MGMLEDLSLEYVSHFTRLPRSPDFLTYQSFINLFDFSTLEKRKELRFDFLESWKGVTKYNLVSLGGSLKFPGSEIQKFKWTLIQVRPKQTGYLFCQSLKQDSFSGSHIKSYNHAMVRALLVFWELMMRRVCDSPGSTETDREWNGDSEKYKI